MNKKLSQLNKIIDGGYCIGCGACASVAPDFIKIELVKNGTYQANIISKNVTNTALIENILMICPFSDKGKHEDEIGRELFGDCLKDSRIGYYKQTYVGHVKDKRLHKKSTSGGIITWLLLELLKKNKVDAVIHVKTSRDEGDVLFKYDVSNTEDDIMSDSKSRYYPIEMSEVASIIKKIPGRYVFVGLPCFIKAIRRLAEVEPLIKERVVFHVGLVCGHLKSKSFADCFGWQSGISPGKLEEIDFRIKLDNQPANNYGVYVRGDNLSTVKTARTLIGGNWGHNLFRYSACDYCDDVFSETADISVGDAWLPGYEKDSSGNSIVVVRNNSVHEILKNGIKKGQLVISNSNIDEIAESQAGGIRDRRDGLAYRLYEKKKTSNWAPKKRIKPMNTHLSFKRRKLYKLRSKIGQESHKAWLYSVEINSLNNFKSFFSRKEFLYKRLYFSFSGQFKYMFTSLMERVRKLIR